MTTSRKDNVKPRPDGNPIKSKSTTLDSPTKINAVKRNSVIKSNATKKDLDFSTPMDIEPPDISKIVSPAKKPVSSFPDIVNRLCNIKDDDFASLPEDSLRELTTKWYKSQ